MNFELIPSRYQDVVPKLKGAVPAFASSAEYCLHNGEMDDLPGVILAAFAQFLARVSGSSPESSPLSEGLDVITDMLAWNDGEVTNAIHDEFFETLADDRNATNVIVLMSPTLRHAYEQWRRQS